MLSVSSDERGVGNAEERDCWNHYSFTPGSGMLGELRNTCSAFGDRGPLPCAFPVPSAVLRTVTIAPDDKKIKFRVEGKA